MAHEMTETRRGNDLDLASAVAMQLCHDLANPIGALTNGLELFESSGDDQHMRDQCWTLTLQSAERTGNMLRFYRMALGGDEAGATAMTEVQAVIHALFDAQRFKVDWQVTQNNLPGPLAGLLLLMVRLGIQALPRGGTITAGITGHGDHLTPHVTGQGARAGLGEDVCHILHNPATPPTHWRTSLPAFTARRALSLGLALDVQSPSPDHFLLNARPHA